MSRTGPNIILITTDQQRYDTVGPAVSDFMRTPHYDFFAREGITFSSAYLECPICVPAQMSIMSEQSPLTSGMTTNGASSRFMGRDGMLPTLLYELGYQTAAIGKMHFGRQSVRHGLDE